MSTLLELVNKTREECGASGGQLATLASATGESLRFKNWCINAWNEIQDLHDDWKWMRDEYEFVATEGQYKYTPTQAGASTRFNYFDKTYCTVYVTANGVSDQLELSFMEYEQFRSTYLTGQQTNSRPLHFSIDLDNSLLIGPAPNEVGYTVAGQYAQSRQELSENTDTPELPEMHDIITDLASMKYARYEAAGEIYDDARRNYKRKLSKLESKYLPTIEICEPML